jgi:hypothetical protein
MFVEPILVLEERAKQQLNLPMMISFGARRKRAGIAQNIAPMLNKFRFAAVGLTAVHEQQTAWQPPMSTLSHRMMPVVERVCRSDFPSRWSILLTFTDLMAVANAAFQRLLEFSNNQISIAQQ